MLNILRFFNALGVNLGKKILDDLILIEGRAGVAVNSGRQCGKCGDG